MRDKETMEGTISMDDYIRVQEKLYRKIEKLEGALAIKNTLVNLMEIENKGFRELLGVPSKIMISDLVNTIEKTLGQLLIDIPIKDLSKIEIKEVLEGILDTIETKFAQV